MITRPQILSEIERGFRSFPIVSIFGPRQCGKTTIARFIAEREGARYFDLEDPRDEAALANPALVLEPLAGLVVLDEAQRRSDLFPLLRVLVDRPGNRARFLLLGSASPSLARNVSESLAGRTAYVEMEGFNQVEIGPDSWERLWLRGGCPPSLLAESAEGSWDWRAGFIRSFLERDIPQLGISVPSSTLRRFWTMCAHYNGQTWNAAELARSLACSEHTARRYLDILTGTFILRPLQPWFANVGKRLVKAPKVYFRDTGLLHSLLGLRGLEELWSHPKVGSSWEGFAISQILAVYREAEPYYYATHNGAELDLYLEHRGRKLGFEIKLSQAPTFTRSMAVALGDLELDALYVVYPGDRRYPIHEKAEALPLKCLTGG